MALAEKVLAGEVTHCPHGRPVMTVFTRAELDKRWEDRVTCTRDLTRGSILRSLLLFALPMLAGDILQQLLQHRRHAHCFARHRA